MVLRDTYINSIFRSASFFLLLLLGACQQSPADNTSSENAAQAAENQKAAKSTVLDIQLQTIRADWQTAMEAMSGTYQMAESMRAGNNGKEKGGSGNENVDAVYEKSATILGSMNILKGSIDAVEKQFNDDMLNEKQSGDMLDKLHKEVQSCLADAKAYQEILGTESSGKEKK